MGQQASFPLKPPFPHPTRREGGRGVPEKVRDKWPLTSLFQGFQEWQ